MEIDTTGLVIICGNYGSGKTETVLNLAARRKKDGLDVKVADLDLVNPYFRTREAKAFLENRGIQLVLPDHQYRHADLPILSPVISGMIQHPSELTLLDAGGDDAGVTVLASLQKQLAATDVQMLQVINPFRPATQDTAGCIRIQKEIENASRLTITGLVGNANLIDETLPEHIYAGYDLLKDLSSATGLDIEFITAPSHILPQLKQNCFACPILEIDRQLTMPWKRF